MGVRGACSAALWRTVRGDAGVPPVTRNCPIPGLISVAGRADPTPGEPLAADRPGGLGLLSLRAA